MDGQFVPNLTFGAPVVKCIRKTTEMFFDCHLMVEQPEKYIADFKAAGADQIVVHVETTKHLHRCIQQIKAEGMKAGVSLNPATPLCTVEEILPYVDMVLLMSVNPGFGGQSFIESTVPKIARLRKMIDDAGLNVDIQVDGGINDKTAVLVKEAGATVLVAGSYVYGAKDVKAAIESLR
jgi:ribulose-phosphate 3-epimerase